jgi:hypothetical protein
MLCCRGFLPRRIPAEEPEEKGARVLLPRSLVRILQRIPAEEPGEGRLGGSCQGAL